MMSFAELPSLNALRAFEAASRHLNFRLAAEELGVTQGAIAQHVRGLEEQLGLKLFSRQARGLALTSNGAMYATSLRQAFELMAQATQQLRPEPLGLSLSVTPSFAAKWLVLRLPRFTSRYPEIELRILATERLAHFQTDAIDLAVRFGKPPFGPGLNEELLMDDVLIPVASPALLQRLGKLEPDNPRLSEYVLLHDAHNRWHRYLECCDIPAALHPSKGLRFNQTSLVIDAAVAGQGVALVHEAFVQGEREAGRLVKVSDHPLRTGAGFYLVFPRKGQHPESVAKVRDWLLEQVQVA